MLPILMAAAGCSPPSSTPAPPTSVSGNATVATSPVSAGAPATPALAAGDPVLAITGPQVRVVRIVDGDTFYAAPVHGDRQIEVRVLGIDTPETKKPGTPVQCGGPEATAYAKRVLSGQIVTLVNDPSQDRLDRYGRTLAYPVLASGGPDDGNTP